MNETFIPRKIASIEDSEEFSINGESGFEGYILTMETGETLSIGVSNSSCCCENFGHICSEDDIQQFVGTNMISYEVVDPEFAKQVNQVAGAEVYDTGELSLDEGDVVFLNVITDQGQLQFTVYNSHNGYYSHAAKVAFGKTVLVDTYL